MFKLVIDGLLMLLVIGSGVIDLIAKDWHHGLIAIALAIWVLTDIFDVFLSLVGCEDTS